MKNELIGFIPSDDSDELFLGDHFNRDIIILPENLINRDEKFYPIVLTKTTKEDLKEAEENFEFSGE